MSEETEAQSVMEILDTLIDILEEARAIPMSASVMVNKSEMLDLLVAARDTVPEQVVRADGVLSNIQRTKAKAQQEAQEIVATAETEGKRIVSEARARAQRLVSEDAITVAARSEAQRIEDEAKIRAERLREGANQYSDETLATLEGRIAEVSRSIEEITAAANSEIDHALSQIYAGRQVIASRTQDSRVAFEDGGSAYEQESVFSSRNANANGNAHNSNTTNRAAYGTGSAAESTQSTGSRHHEGHAAGA
ncbi:hypothetical protein SAMN05421878_11427 [Actinobaculum suis]|uniref:ATPase n=1 Tax=Actinobaculum suis TaxID=1657 RepID=A0A1G7E179_9ACTO|nr:hypothetical protein [Actinobaculum suis]MDY5153275.1 hypothetical protein [Actinobaculum suis]SDE57457.1 hypothetical protein SAMN05421878_11427 [Actinobaculum suis]VDG76272.1 Uncharacterised protein [Actinobaculum suis]